MNDLEKFKALMDSFGVKYEQTGNDGFNMERIGFNFDTCINISDGCGYSFYTDWYFLEGKFMGHGEWE